jgi:predicted DsbA family dithiol-disulfide isomerase
MVKVRYLVGILAILSIAAMACTPGGDKTTVTVAQGVAYYESTDGNLYAVDTNTGLKKWSFDTKGGLTSEPVVSGGVVYFGGKDGSLFAVDAATGTQKWAFKEKKASARKEVKVEQAEQTVSEKAKVEFFVMSQCPFGTQVETGIAPVLKKIGGDVDFTLDFIGGVQGDQLTSLHKEAEVQGDIVQICAIKYAPENYRYMDMIECMNKNYRAIPGNWEECANSTGMPVDKIRECYEGGEGKGLLKASFGKAQAKRASGSPTMYIGGEMYRGGRTEQAFTRAICNAYPKDKPKLCADIPPPVEVPVTVLSDARCADCRTDVIEQQMKSLFPGAVVKVVDYASDEGKKMYTEFKLKKLPVIFFGKEIEKAENYNRMQRSLQPMGDYLVHARWGRFDPTKEICNNKKDDTGNGKIDCDDPDCKHALECRKEEKNKLEVFVMSMCPYGTKALDAMKEVLDNFKRDIKFEVHYIADEDSNGGLSSMHGLPEVEEDIRELCAMKYYNKNYKYMDYIWCRNKNIRDNNWQACTGGKTGIDAKLIEKCSTGPEGKRLLGEDIKVAEGLGVAASPTWFANGVQKFSGIDPERIKENFCRFNKIKGCENKLSGPDQNVRPGACK